MNAESCISWHLNLIPSPAWVRQFHPTKTHLFIPSAGPWLPPAKCPTRDPPSPGPTRTRHRWDGESYYPKKLKLQTGGVQKNDAKCGAQTEAKFQE